MARVCASCGARIEPDADRCGLCGLPVDEDAVESAEAREEISEHAEGSAAGENPGERRGESADRVSAKAPDGPVVCPDCERENPADARFCNRCGSSLESGEGVPVRDAKGGADLPRRRARGGGSESVREGGDESGASSRELDSSGDVSTEEGSTRRRVLGTLVVGLLLVAGLYGVTALSEGGSGGTSSSTVSSESPPGAPPSGGSAGSGARGSAPGSGGGPSASGSRGSAVGGSGASAGAGGGGTGSPGGELGAATQARVDSLTRAIDTADGAERMRALREELVRVYVHAERYERAGSVQERIAEQVGTAEAWARAGNFYYDGMMRASGSTRTEYARKAISAYRRSLELDPDDLDVRTDMAVAYLYDPENPMQAIRQTDRVLEQDPDHVQANFNRGVMLLQIGRSEQAVDQFQKVMSLTPDTSVAHRRAQQALRRVQSN